MARADLEAFCWSMTALAIILSVLRYFIRSGSPKKFMWDDLTHLLALGTFVASVALYQTVFRDGYYIQGLQRELIPLPSQELYGDLYIRFQHRALAITILSFTTLWLVKATFLLFYRQIFWIDGPFRKGWWAVTFFIIVTYWATLAGVLIRCGSVENVFSIVECTKPQSIAYKEALLKYTCALGMASDVAIITLPIWKLKGLQMHVRQKLGIGVMFSLGIIITTFELVRTIKSEGRSNFSKTVVYNIAHIGVAIIVSSVSVYRSFLTGHRRSNKKGYPRNFNGAWLIHAESRGARQLGGIKHYTTLKRDTDLDVEVRIPEGVHV